ncbi:F-box/LRR-repeat protein At3g48880-like [Arachis duranensis]|uniref:F-box/LRR-repeat protein At3g48880-like n=1 Tax=Arachis duranensis TaxID=130453 RepID=A0A9C6TKQ2_ARADU|nr:F-box/LRR-repeat protein At3g48880-like [Arachis duranensis]
MKECVEFKNTDARNINDVLYYELLVNIFMAFNVVELATVSRVCKTWREVRSDPKLWHKLDLSVLCYKPFNVPRMLGSWRDSSERLTKILRGILTQSEVEHIRCFVFNYYTYLKDEHLLLVAERTPNLKMLVLPAICNFSKEAIEHAISLWVGLESITITRMINHKDIFLAIGKYCKGITSLKFTTGFKMDHARALIEHTPNLKFLNLQSIIVSFRALCCVLENLKHLEILNLCHSLIIDKPDTSNQVVLYTFCQLQHHQWPLLHRLRKILTCQSNNGCAICKNRMAGHNYLIKKALHEAFE